MLNSYNSVDMRGKIFNYDLSYYEDNADSNGAPIVGEVGLQVDDSGTIVEVRYYAKPVYNSGKPNRTYKFLEEIMNGEYKTVTEDGDEASWIGVTGSIDVGYYIAKGQGPQELNRSQKIRGLFINQNKKKEYANLWKLDMLITQVDDIEADPEKRAERFLKVRGYMVDDYRERLMEVEFQARDDAAIRYISSLPASYDKPYSVPVWGGIRKVSTSTVRKNAFGEDIVDNYDAYRWVITGMSPNPYDFSNDSVEAYNNFKKNLSEHQEEIIEKSREGEPELAF